MPRKDVWSLEGISWREVVYYDFEWGSRCSYYIESAKEETKKRSNALNEWLKGSKRLIWSTKCSECVGFGITIRSWRVWSWRNVMMGHPLSSDTLADNLWLDLFKKMHSASILPVGMDLSVMPFEECWWNEGNKEARNHGSYCTSSMQYSSCFSSSFFLV